MTQGTDITSIEHNENALMDDEMQSMLEAAPLTKEFLPLEALPAFMAQDATLKSALLEMAQGKAMEGVALPVDEQGQLLAFDERVIWAIEQQKAALKQSIIRGFNYQSLALEKGWQKKELVAYMVQQGDDNRRIYDDLNAAQFFLEIVAELDYRDEVNLSARADKTEFPARAGKTDTVNTILNDLPIKTFHNLKALGAHETLRLLDEGIITPATMQRNDMANIIKDLIDGQKREANLEKENDKLKQQHDADKETIARLEGRDAPYNQRAFYYRKQTGLLTEEANRLVTGFDEVLAELNADPNSAEVFESAATDLFIKYQGLVADVISGFERIKAQIPADFQTAAMAALHSYSDAEILEMQRLAEMQRGGRHAQKLKRQTEAETTAKAKR